jgi:hypothetical protein
MIHAILLFSRFLMFEQVMDVLSRTFSQFHTSTNFHLKMPDPFTDDTVDLIGEFQRIRTTTYKSDRKS